MLNLLSLIKNNSNNINKNSNQRFKNRFQGEGKIYETVFPEQKGRIYFKGSYWFARCNLDLILNPGDIVEVIDRQALTLIVIPKTP